jgi:hypothetical protein
MFSTWRLTFRRSSQTRVFSPNSSSGPRKLPRSGALEHRERLAAELCRNPARGHHTPARRTSAAAGLPRRARGS